MTFQEPIEAALNDRDVKQRIQDIYELLGTTAKEAKVRLLTELAEELSNHYNVTLQVKDRKENELRVHKISIDLNKTPMIAKWLNFNEK